MADRSWEAAGRLTRRAAAPAEDLSGRSFLERSGREEPRREARGGEKRSPATVSPGGPPAPIGLTPRAGDWPGATQEDDAGGAVAVAVQDGGHGLYAPQTCHRHRYAWNLLRWVGHPARPSAMAGLMEENMSETAGVRRGRPGLADTTRSGRSLEATADKGPRLWRGCKAGSAAWHDQARLPLRSDGACLAGQPDAGNVGSADSRRRETTPRTGIEGGHAALGVCEFKRLARLVWTAQ
jgi:hypothetical protein